MGDLETMREWLTSWSSLPLPGTPEDVAFTTLYYQLSLDQQITLLRDFAPRTRDGRAWKLLGLCYFWICDDAFLEDAIESLTKALAIGFDGMPDAAYEVLACCYACLDNEQAAKQCILRSSRADLNYIIRHYGSLRRFADAMRHSKDGLRFRGMNSGVYTKDQLHLRGPGTGSDTHGWRRGCRDPQVRLYLERVIWQVESATPYLIHFYGAEKLNEIHPMLALPVDIETERGDPSFIAGRLYYCYLFIEIDGGDCLMSEETRALNREIAHFNPGKLDDWLKFHAMSRHFVEDEDFASVLSTVLGATVYAVGAMIENTRRFRKFSWVLRV